MRGLRRRLSARVPDSRRGFRRWRWRWRRSRLRLLVVFLLACRNDGEHKPILTQVLLPANRLLLGKIDHHPGAQPRLPMLTDPDIADQGAVLNRVVRLGAVHRVGKVENQPRIIAFDHEYFRRSGAAQIKDEGLRSILFQPIKNLVQNRSLLLRFACTGAAQKHCGTHHQNEHELHEKKSFSTHKEFSVFSGDFPPKCFDYLIPA